MGPEFKINFSSHREGTLTCVMVVMALHNLKSHL